MYVCLVSLGLVCISIACSEVDRRGAAPTDSGGTDTGSDSDTGTDADTDTDTDTDPGTDTDTDPGYDCGALPPGPLSFGTIGSPVTGEDIAFDDAGNLIGMGGGDLFKSPKIGGSTLWISGSGCSSGLRALSTGDVVCNCGNSFCLFDKTDGVKQTILNDLSYPNGIEVDLDGFAYISQQGAGEVTKVDPYTGESWTVASGLNSPNGLSFSPDYTMLYVGSFGGGVIYAIPFDGEGEPSGAPVTFLTISDPAASAAGMTGAFDGMGVDACGNVYVCDYGIIHVYRIAPDASEVEMLVDLSSASSWIPNLQWGSGYGGWLADTLYVSNMGGGAFEVPVGVPGKPRAYP